MRWHASLDVGEGVGDIFLLRSHSLSQYCPFTCAIWFCSLIFSWSDSFLTLLVALPTPLFFNIPSVSSSTFALLRAVCLLHLSFALLPLPFVSCCPSPCGSPCFTIYPQGEGEKRMVKPTLPTLGHITSCRRGPSALHDMDGACPDIPSAHA